MMDNSFDFFFFFFLKLRIRKSFFLNIFSDSAFMKKQHSITLDPYLK